MSPLGNGLAYAFCAELVTEQSSTGDAPPDAPTPVRFE